METPQPKPSRLAMISVIFPVAILLLWCLFIAGMAILAGVGNDWSLTEKETLGYAYFLGGPLLGGAITMLLSLAGLIVGIIAVWKKDPRRNLAIAGIVINFLCFCPYLIFVIFAASSGSGKYKTVSDLQP